MAVVLDVVLCCCPPLPLSINRGNDSIQSRPLYNAIGQITSLRPLSPPSPGSSPCFCSSFLLQPSPADDSSNTHTGTYESDFRLLKADLAASFNQWRRHLTFRMEGFTGGGSKSSSSSSSNGDNNSGGGGSGTGVRSGNAKRGGSGGGSGAGHPRDWEGRSAYGLSRGKEIRYHTYQVGAWVDGWVGDRPLLVKYKRRRLYNRSN